MNTKLRNGLIASVVVLAVVGGLTYEVIATAPVRGAVRTCSALLTAANRPGMPPKERVAAAQALCSRRYLDTHTIEVAGSGEGLVGVPRNLNKNFQGWRHGEDVWICPTNRIGPIYQFVYEDGSWKFDGPIGILRPRGEIVPMSDVPGLESGG